MIRFCALVVHALGMCVPSSDSKEKETLQGGLYGASHRAGQRQRETDPISKAQLMRPSTQEDKESTSRKGGAREGIADSE
jgi:hypothetical protein